ncbi:nicotinamide mononucleotide transporter [Reichenbachiella faecimaris]|uniref:Nicotinamide riboside transporter PnuC n=1 Tax=Reichenbachiella faecimaris TaxID=692418 RepID=A0A1W2G4V8_REIFA|nr:nicotinamide riboside transporter PnuC [Reichenbachiella faecimaris]SMD31707.1 nicotinamide mononucleotide transporter [Reichenbachiella faecimaris]
MNEIVQEILSYALSIDLYEFFGLVFGLLAVWYLIKESILTWPAGILYVIVSFVVFWKIQLYGDLLLHLIFLVLNIYGWYFWVFGKKKNEKELPITTYSLMQNAYILLLSIMGILGFGYFLAHIHFVWSHIPPAALPYWDSTTSILSVTGIWLMTKKKLENWYYWFIVDVLACGIYFYKGIYFYSFLYGIYIAMAVSGYLAWKKSPNLLLRS